MSIERLEQIKDAIAYELGLTDDWMDGTYLYYLMRSKSAFAVGTMTLNDFKEIDEELLDEIFNAIEPFFIEQAERVRELEELIEDYKTVNKELHDRRKKLRKQNKRYREYLELIKTIGTYGKDINTGEIIRSDEANLAEEALEGEK